MLLVPRVFDSRRNHTHTHTRMHAHTQTHTHKHAHKHARTHTHTHTHTSMRACTCMYAPVSAIHIHMVMSSEPARSTLPLGCHRTHSMAPSGPSRVCTSCPVAASQTLTTPARACGKEGALCGEWASQQARCPLPPCARAVHPCTYEHTYTGSQAERTLSVFVTPPYGFD